MSDVFEDLGNEIIRLARGVWPAAEEAALAIKNKGIFGALPAAWEVEAKSESRPTASPEKVQKQAVKKVIRSAFFEIEELKDLQKELGGEDVPERFKIQLDYKINERLVALVDRLREATIHVPKNTADCQCVSSSPRHSNNSAN